MKTLAKAPVTTTVKIGCQGLYLGSDIRLIKCDTCLQSRPSLVFFGYFSFNPTMGVCLCDTESERSYDLNNGEGIYKIHLMTTVCSLTM